MYKNIDDENPTYEGFYYCNKFGHKEYVKLHSIENIVEITLELEDDGTQIYKEDIPKLIRALQAAYDYKGN